MRFIVFLSFYLLSTFEVVAQQPSYYIFGESQFRGIDIYDVIQDLDQNYWFATDQGLIKHDGYKYEKVICKEMNGSSVFNLTIDEFGDIYCFNLNHQIFRIRDGAMQLYHELTSGIDYHQLFIEVDQQNNLIIQNSGITFISPDKKKITQLTKELFKNGTYPISFCLMPDGSTVSTSSTSVMAHQKDGKIELLDYSHLESLSTSKKVTSVFFWITLNEKVYAIDRNTMQAFTYYPDSKTFEFKRQLSSVLEDQIIRVHQADSKLWITGNGGGVYVYDEELNPLYNENLIYPNHFISDVYTDQEDNILLSTFDEGVLIIPNYSVQGLYLPGNKKIMQITSAPDGTVFLGANTGDLFSYDLNNGSLNKIYSDPKKKSIEKIAFWKQRNTLLYTTGAGINVSDWDGQKLTHSKFETGSLKAVDFIDSKTALLAMNHGIDELIFDKKGGSLEHISSLQKRTYSVIRDSKTGSIYAGLSNGLHLLQVSGKPRIIEIKGSVVFANSFVFNEGKVYVGSRKHGILIFENDRLLKHIPFDDQIRQLEIYKDQLFVLTTTDLFIGNKDGSQLKKINKSTGLSCDRITTFHVSDDKLFLTNSDYLEYVDLKNIVNTFNKIQLHFKKIEVNGKVATSSSFSHDQRKLRFEFGVSTLRYRENIHYRYKLKGYDTEWQLVDYDENFITYNGLPAGTYTFIVQSINGQAHSDPIEYSFEIDAPFYQKWWFYILIFITSGVVIALFYSIRIKRIREKNKERLEKQRVHTDLLESQLKALRSQMNPHFIFNALNSIQDLILKEETDASYDYIVLFADLVRNTLNYTNKDFIPIEKEIDFLEVYLSLEKLRFKDEFEYSIVTNEISGINVPSLLIQPFIENALVHGLMHKEGLKRLTITFELSDKLICTIKDNGVGRTRAKEIQQRQQGHHESFALKAIEKRLEILSEQTGQSTEYEILDLIENGNPKGTEVVLTIPYKHTY